MAYNISAFAGAGAQFFDNNGDILSGGLLYVYTAGTTTPVTTWTSNSGAVANTNPIVLDSAGRTPNEIWLNSGVTYKFVLKTSTGTLIGTYDNIPAIDDPTVFNNLITVTGTDTLIGTSTPPYTAYVAGMTLSFIPTNTNTGAVTLDLDGLGAKNIYVGSSTALAAGQIVAGRMIQIEYDGTRFQLGQTTIAAGSITTAELADNSVTTAKLVNGAVTIAKLSATGTPSATTVLKGDGTWGVVGGNIGESTYTSNGADLTLTATSTPVQTASFTAANKKIVIPAASTMAEGATFSIRNPGRVVAPALQGIYDSAGKLITATAYSDVSVVENNGANYWATAAAPGGVIDAVYPTSISDVYGGSSTLLHGVAKISSTSWLVFWARYSGATVTGLYAQAFSVSGTTVTAGTAVLVASGAFAPIDVCVLSSSAAFVLYSTTLIGATITVAPLVLSGLTITVGTTASVTTTNPSNTVYGPASICAANSTTAVCVYFSSTTASNVRAIQHNGTSAPTLGTGVAFATLSSVQSFGASAVTVDTATNKVAIASGDDGGTNSYVAICTVSGTTVTKGTNLSLSTSVSFLLRDAYSTSEVLLDNGTSVSISGTTATNAGLLRKVATANIANTAVPTGGTIAYVVNASSNSLVLMGTGSLRTPPIAIAYNSYGRVALTTTRFVGVGLIDSTNNVTAVEIVDVAT